MIGRHQRTAGLAVAALAFFQNGAKAEPFDQLMSQGWQVAGIAETGSADPEFMVLVQNGAEVQVCVANTIQYASGPTLQIGNCAPLAANQ